MKAVTYRGAGQVAVEDVPQPRIQRPGDAIVRGTRCAVGGSDLHVYHGHIPGMVPGFACGHEWAGATGTSTPPGPGGRGPHRSGVIVSQRLPLSEAAEGYRLFDGREAIKVVLVPGQ